MLSFGDGVFQSIINDNKGVFSDLKILREYNLDISPTQHFFHCPSPGDYISYFTYDELSKNFYYNTLSNYIDFIDNEILSEFNIPQSKHPNAVYSPSYGDTYIGKYGRIFLNDNVIISSDNYRAKAYFYDDGLYENRSYNFKIRTEDSSVAIYTTSSDSINKFGDSLNIEINKFDYSLFKLSNISKEQFNFDGTYFKKIMFLENEEKYIFDFSINSEPSLSFEFGYNSNHNRFFSFYSNKDKCIFKTEKHEIMFDILNNKSTFKNSDLTIISDNLNIYSKDISINCKESISPIILGGPGMPSPPVLEIMGFLVLKLNGKEIKIPYSI